MSNKKMNRNRKCSAVLAAGAGAAICLTGGDALAVAGNVCASNGGSGACSGNVTLGPTNSVPFNLFNSAAVMVFVPQPTSALWGSFAPGPLLKISTSGVISHFASGVTVGPGGISLTISYGINRPSQLNNYVPMSFESSGTKFGWVHVVSTNALGTQMIIDTWGYNTLGGAIKTLSESVTTSRLALTDGKEKLHWTNENEDGVARYEVQSKDASGEWVAADSDVPGEGSYSAKVAAGATSRLVVEMTDGTTKEIDF